MTDRALHYFLVLNPDERAAAIRRMAVQGWGDSTIATATGLSIEQVRALLAEHRQDVSA